MATPITSKNTQESCNPISSNCVIWQGPDIPCIGICRGDSISDITYKLATELCALLTQVDVETFDLTCFEPMCPTPDNFHDLIQLLITKICALEAAGAATTGGSSSTSGSTFRLPGGGTTPSGGGVGNAVGASCPDCLITVPQCFWYYDQFGSLITQMQLVDYATAMANKICSLVNQIANIESNIRNMQLQINFIIANYKPIPPIPLPTFITSCLTDKIPSYPPEGISLFTMVTAIDSALCDLRTATGMPNEILNSIFKQCVSLDTSASLNIPGVSMGSLPGWVTSVNYSTLANSINNMWITICDMRAAVSTILSTCCPQGCSGLMLDLQLTFTTPNLNFFFSGNATGFEDCMPAGSLVTITDSFGAFYTTRIPIVANIGGQYILSLSATPLNLNSNLHVTVESCIKAIDGSAQCERQFTDLVLNSALCPALTLSAGTTSVTYSFNNTIVGPVTYDITLRETISSAFVDAHSVTTSTNGVITNTFSVGLYAGTQYTVTIEVTVGSDTISTCPVGVITTQSLACDSATNVFATTVL